MNSNRCRHLVTVGFKIKLVQKTPKRNKTLVNPSATAKEQQRHSEAKTQRFETTTATQRFETKANSALL
jgi:hypothetical protein